MAYSALSYNPNLWGAPAAPPGSPPPKKPPANPWDPTDPFAVGNTGDQDPNSTWTTPKSGTTSQWDNDGRLSWDTSGNPNLDPKGIFDGPGYDEQWYLDHKDQFDQPSDAEQYWNSVSGPLAAGPERSTGAKSGYDEWFNGLDDPGYTEKGAAAGPRGTDYTGDAYGNRDTGPTRSETFADSGGPQFSNYGQGAFANGAQNTTFDAGKVFDTFFDPLSQKSDSENLYGQDPGMGAYYDRASDTGTEKIRNAMAARGMFGSGAAVDEERQLASDLGADRAKNEAYYKLQAAGQSDAERRARMGLASDMGSAADSSSVNRSTNARNWASVLDDNELKQEQERRAGREFADTEGDKRDTRNLDWSKTLDDQSLARSADDRAWGVAADNNKIARSGESRNWSDLLDKETNDNNKNTLDFVKTGGDLSKDSDIGKANRLGSGLDAAKAANNSLRTRYQDQFDNLIATAKSKSSLVSGAVDDATKQKINTVIERLKAELGGSTDKSNTAQQNSDAVEKDLATLATLLEAA